MNRAVLLTTLALSSGLSAEPVDELIDNLAGFDQLSGHFLQTQYTPGDEVLGESSGSFKLLKPVYFSWAISDPDNQLILADESFLWHYDQDLETVTRRPVAGNAELSPLQVLGGNVEVLRDHYRVESDGMDRFTLIPEDVQPGFNQVTIEFLDGEIAAMEVIDNLQQRITIEFDDLDSSTLLHPQDFAFSPPDGVDLFHYDQ